jgi:hypothetical protein
MSLNHFVFSWGFLGIGLFGEFYCGWKITMAYRSKSWPQTKGNILSSGMVENLSRNSRPPTYSPYIYYEYTVDGEHYKNKDGFIAIFGGNYSIEDATEILERFITDGSVTVYYDPLVPSHSLLDRRVRLLDFLGVIVPLVFIAIGIANLLKTVYKDGLN